MRSLFILLVASLLLISAEAELERGLKGDVEDVILVGADDWHGVVAATPLAIWSEDNGTVIKPLLILPRDISSGERLGWVEQSDLDRYGAISVLRTLESVNISAIIIHGSGDQARSLVDTAHKDGLKAYLTVSLDAKSDLEPFSADLEKLILEDEVESASRAAFLKYADPDIGTADGTNIDPERLQKRTAGEVGDSFCPVNPEVREELYKQMEELIEDYEADGVVLYGFGFQDENYCFCDFCKNQFYKDTGIDLSKIYSSSYNLERWKKWKQDQISALVRDARNISRDLGPVQLGVAIGDPFDRSKGYNFAEMAQMADFAVISPIQASDVKLASSITKNPVFIRLSDDYVEYILSTQNVEGTVGYIEDAKSAGAGGFAYEYSVVYTPLWSELQPPSNSARWLLKHLNGKILGLGNVSWRCDTKIAANSSFDLAEKISQRWKSSPGAVIVGDDYSSGLKGAVLASYLNWPILFSGTDLPKETRSALERLGSKEAAIVGDISDGARSNLTQLNLTLIEDAGDLLLREMKARGFNPGYVVMTNSHDLSLLPPVIESEFKRNKVGDIIVDIEINPGQIPAERAGEIVRLNITLKNSNIEDIHNIQVVDLFSPGKLLRWPKPSRGTVKITDPYTGENSTPENSFENGSLLIWEFDILEAEKSASLTMELEIMYPMDAGWRQPLDRGFSVIHSDLSPNITLEERDDWPITNITYPGKMPVGTANISWNVERTPSFTALNIFTPHERKGSKVITDTAPGRLYTASMPLFEPGIWKFNIEAGDGYAHKTKDYLIEVKSNVAPVNVTAFSHTKVPRLSLVSAQAAAARQGILLDLDKNPQKIEPEKEEKWLQQQAENWGIYPQFLAVVGDPGSLPFISTELRQNISDFMSYDIYRDYQLNLDDDNYSEVAQGRVLALSVYDASQMLARTMAYDRIEGQWKDKALVISSPPLDFPQSPTAISIGDYLRDSGLRAKNLRWEEATYQEVTSQMNNGQNIVDFEHHGDEQSWLLSYWSMMDVALDETQVKQLVLTPQTTTTSSCLTARLKGFSINITGTEMYVPMKLDDSMALAFIRAGSVNYIGPTSLSLIFLSDDHSKRFYQALVYENATVGQAEVKADNLYRMKLNGATGIKNVEEYEELLPEWDTSIQGMLNQTRSMNTIIGDPAFRPYLPKVPNLPYEIETEASNETGENLTEAKYSIKPTSEKATNWIYWIETETADGQLKLNAPPAMIGELLLPQDAEEVVVKENGQAIWHDEDIAGSKKRILWPVVRPRLNETRTFSVEYKVIPSQVQVINVTAGWNAISIYLRPKEALISRYLENKPYRGIFSASDQGWIFTMKESDAKNLSTFEPGYGYLIDSAESFSFKVPGKSVELPYRFKLNKGWNLVGVPFNSSVDIRNITVNAEHKRYSYSEAIAKGLISAFLWTYEGQKWSYIGMNETLEPGKAYLVEAVSDSRLEFRG